MEEEGEEEKKKKATGEDNQAESTEPAADEPGSSTGSVRFYDCVYCKRGFTTAQALGGHMNMHRQDRARLRPSRPSSSSPRKSEEAYHPYSRAQRAFAKQTVDESSSSYVVYFPASSEEASQKPAELVQAAEELQLGLGGSGPKEEEEEKKKEVVEEDLDLELRLGHSKSHDDDSD